MDISVRELHQKLQTGEKFVFIDVREPWEYEEFNLGGQLIPLGELMNRAWELDDHKNDEIVVLPQRHGAKHAGQPGLCQRSQHDRRRTGLERRLRERKTLSYEKGKR
jgi:hypothetical protein